MSTFFSFDRSSVQPTQRWVFRALRCALLAGVALPMVSCTFLDSFVPKKGQTSDVIDRQQNLTTDDFRDLNDVKKLKKATETEGDVKATAVLASPGVPAIPDLAQVLSAPKAPKVANSKLVTLAVTEDVPLRDVLFELGRLAKVDIEVGTGLDTAGINLRATERPFNEVIERIAQMAHLRYSVSGSSIRVERDLPYIKNYSLDFLNIVRSTTSTYSLSTNIFAAGGAQGGGAAGGGAAGGAVGGGAVGGGGGAVGGGAAGGAGGAQGGAGFGATGSTNNITSQSESDLFSSLEASIAEIINYNPDGTANTANGAAGTNGAAPAPAAPAGAAAGTDSTTQAVTGVAGANFVVNRQSNVLTVNASEKQHEMVERFISLLSRNASAQVLIEAKIVEVSLADQFLSGVDWSSVIGDSKKFIAPGEFRSDSIGSLSLPSAANIANARNGGVAGAFTFGIQNSTLDAVVSMTNRFGTTRTLSSPRLSAINNQQAVLTFARNEVFFNCTAQQGAVIANTGTSGSTATQPTVNCQQSTVPIGIIMSILPSINLATQEVTLNVRPTLTRQVKTVQNPGNVLAAAVVSLPSGITINSDVPVIEVRELDSVMKVKSGGVMVIGGLMEDATRNEDTGVPGLGEVPFLGNLFKTRSEDSLKRELIIFIKATIVGSDGSTHDTDKLIYKKYMKDPRPIIE